MNETRYYTLSQYFKQHFGMPVFKIPLDAGFTCPNRDGSIGRDGCSFCHNPSFSPFADQKLNLEEQIEKYLQKAGSYRRQKKQKYLAYIQSYTGTYAPLKKLKLLYDQVFTHPEVVGMAIGTRPDCVPNEVIALIQNYALHKHVWIEYGLQSINNRTLQRINRGHTAEQFVDAVQRTRIFGPDIHICAHVILGLPGETVDDALHTAQALSRLGVDGVKIHHLQIIKGTPLAGEWREGKVPVLSTRDYLRWICAFLEHLDSKIVIHRLLGDALTGDLLLAPRWELNKTEIIRQINEELKIRNSFQGKSCSLI